MVLHRLADIHQIKIQTTITMETDPTINGSANDTTDCKPDYIILDPSIAVAQSDDDKQQDVSNSTTTDDAESDNKTSNGSRSATRFKWTKEKSQVAMNLVKYGCKPKLVSVAVGCSLRTAQKFVEKVAPKMKGGAFKDFEIRRRGRKSKDINNRLQAIRDVLSKDSTKTQVEIAADLKVSNTTVCRDLKRLGTSLKDIRDDAYHHSASPSKNNTSNKNSNTKDVINK